MPKTTVRLNTELKAGEFEVDMDAGVLRGVSIISEGPALGHGIIIDKVMVAQVVKAINEAARGIKSRMTHPGRSSDPIKTLVGRTKDAVENDGKARADVHFGKYADASPSGNLKSYLLAIAEEDPELIGISIEYVPDADGVGPDTMPAARLKELVGVDFVGEPAANPAGLLSEGNGEKENEMAKPKGKSKKDETEDVNPLASPVDLEDTGDEPETEKDSKMQKLRKKEIAEAKTEAASLERERASEIMALASRFELGDEWAEKAVIDGLSVAAAKDAALEKIETKHKALSAAATDVEVGDDLNVASLMPAISDAVLLRSKQKLVSIDSMTGTISPREPHKRAREFRGRSLSGMARGYLKALGARGVDEMTKAEVASLVFSRAKLAQRVSLAHATGDFPYILADAAGKTLRQAYEEMETKWSLFCRRASASDYKQVKRNQLGAMPALTLTPEGGPVTYVTIGEEREVYALAKYTGGFEITREAVINDELGAFSRLPMMEASAAARLEDNLAFTILTANAALNDGIALFHASHSNLVGAGSGAAPSVTTLNAARTALRKQTGNASAAYLNLEPKFLIGPAAHEGTILELLQSQVNPAASAANVKNIWAGLLTPVIHPILDANSATIWYLAASADQIDTIEVCFLEGEEAPVMEQEDNFDSDTRKFKIRHSVAAKAIDYRGLYMNAGA